MQIFVIAALLVALVSIVFAVQNPGLVTVQFLAWKFQGSLALVLLITFAFGFASSVLLSLSGVFKRRRLIRAQHRRIQELEGKAGPHGDLPS